jgi:CRISPR-associated endonuclease/helicase Cas3
MNGEIEGRRRIVPCLFKGKGVFQMYISRIAKDGREQSTRQHLHECAEYACNIGKKFKASTICRTVALFHDIGKLSSVFIEYLKDSYINEKHGNKRNKRGSVVHSTQGAKYLYELQSNFSDLIATLTQEISAICIANHHGGLMDGISPCGDTPFRERLVRENGDLHYAEVIKAAEKEHISINSVSDILKQCRSELKEFIEKCKENKLNTAFMLHLLTKSVFSCLVDSDRYNAYCFEINKTPEIERPLPPWEDYAHRLEQKFLTFPADSDINKIRRDISEKCLYAASQPKGIYRLDVPTGGGKTLSSLRFALNHAKIHKAEHVIYVIPYLSVLEQTADDIKDALQYKPRDNFILEHHSNFIINDDSEEAQAYRLLTDRWDSPIIITTMVQFLESIYSNKSSDLRKFHNMANAIFIFDEVQSLPLKCTYLFNEVINYLFYCADCSILLCTATQPPLNEAEKPILSKLPSLIPDMSGSFHKLKRTYIKDCTIPGGYSTKAFQLFVMDKYQEEENCLVIVNTKKDAARIYNSLKSYIEANLQSQIKLLHLSTTMCPAHRLDTINKIKAKKQKRVLCISTQLIEAGVNISFNCVIRAIAGLDSIAQAAGRCNRNGEDPCGKNVYIVNLAEENLSMLPDIKCGADITYRILTEHPTDVLSSAVIQRYYKEYFEKQKSQMYYPVKELGNLYDLLSINQKGTGAYQNMSGSNPPALRQAFQTAGEQFSVIEQKSIGVLVPYGDGVKLIEKYKHAELKEKNALLRQIGRYSVSLYPYQIRMLDEMRALTLIDDAVIVLDPKYYHDKLGVIFNTNTELLII